MTSAKSRGFEVRTKQISTFVGASSEHQFYMHLKPSP